MSSPSSHPLIDNQFRTSLRNRIIAASSFLEIVLSGLVLIGLVLSMVPLLRLMPDLVVEGNDVNIRSFLECSLDIVIGIEFIKMLAKHSPGSSLEVLLYAIARHMVVGHESAVENLLSVGAIALIFIVRKFFFVPAFGSHLPDGHPAPDLAANTACPAQSAPEEDEEPEGDTESDELPHLVATLLDGGKTAKADLTEKLEHAVQAHTAEKAAEPAATPQPEAPAEPSAPAPAAPVPSGVEEVSSGPVEQYGLAPTPAAEDDDDNYDLAFTLPDEEPAMK